MVNNEAEWRASPRPPLGSSMTKLGADGRKLDAPPRDASRCCYTIGMRQTLRLHPDSPPFAAIHIDVDVARPRADRLVLSYLVTGRISDLHLAPVVAAARADELWRHTCFEAFVRTSPGAAYYEFNFAPSTQWAVYRFSGYRSGMRVASEIGAPRIEVQSSAERYRLQATLELDQLAGLPRDAPWRLGLSALVEDRNGRPSYWALAHPPGKADFHHADCFAHELSPP